MKTLYGDSSPALSPVPNNLPSVQPHPSLNGIKVGLAVDGAVNFESADWKFGVSPPSLALSSPQLLHGEGLQLLKVDDGEIGVSFDKKSTRHFFLFGKSLNASKFSLSFKVILKFFYKVVTIQT